MAELPRRIEQTGQNEKETALKPRACRWSLFVALCLASGCPRPNAPADAPSLASKVLSGAKGGHVVLCQNQSIDVAANVRQLVVISVGGGGGGGGGSTALTLPGSGGGGGEGAEIVIQPQTITKKVSYDATIGAGGPGGIGGLGGQAGVTDYNGRNGTDGTGTYLVVSKLSGNRLFESRGGSLGHGALWTNGASGAGTGGNGGTGGYPGGNGQTSGIPGDSGAASPMVLQRPIGGAVNRGGAGGGGGASFCTGGFGAQAGDEHNQPVLLPNALPGELGGGGGGGGSYAFGFPSSSGSNGGVGGPGFMIILYGNEASVFMNGSSVIKMDAAKKAILDAFLDPKNELRGCACHEDVLP